MKDPGVQTDNIMNLPNWLLLELREEIKNKKIVRETAKAAILVSTNGMYFRNLLLASVSLRNVEQTEDTTFDDFLDKINKLSKRVRELEKSIF